VVQAVHCVICMRALLRSVVDLRAGEARQVVRLGLALFAILGGHTLLETARDALFLQSLPVRHLALVYGVMAVLAMVAVPVGARAVRRLGRRDALVATLAVSAIGTTALYAVPVSTGSVFTLYLWTGLIATIVVVQLWLVAGQLLTVAQGKRLLGLIAAAGALGAVVAAALAGVILTWLPVQHLLPLSAALFLLAAGAVRGTPDAAEPVPAHCPARPAVAAVRGQSYLARLAFLVAVATSTLLATDYLFKAAAVQTIAAADLPVFFARYSAVVTGLSFIVQLVGASWLVRRTGVVAALVVLPLVLLLGAAGAFALHGAFAAILVAKAADGVLRHSLHRVSMELLWMPLPEEVRDQVKEPIDGALVRVAQAVTAAGLLGLAAAGLDSSTVLAAVVGGLALIWLAAAIGLRRPYLDQFRRALARPTFAPPRDQELDLDAVEVLIEAMSSADSRQVRAAIAVLASHGRARLVPALVLLHADPDVLRDALAVVAVPERRDWIALGRRLLAHPAAAVRTAALRPRAPPQARDVGACPAGTDPAMRAHVAFWHAHTAGHPEMAADPAVAAILAAPGSDGHAARCALLDAIGEDGDARWVGVVLALVKDGAGAGDPNELLAHAVPAIERTPDARFIPVLIDRLAVRDGRADVLVALLQLGEPALTALEEAFVDPTTPNRLRLHLPQAIAAFGTQRAADSLVAQMSVHGATGYRVLRSLARLAVRHRVRVARRPVLAELDRNLREHVRLLGVEAALAAGRSDDEMLRVLRGLVTDKRDQALDRAFLLLQVLHADEDLRGVHQAITAGTRNERAHALELLDALTRHALYDAAGAELIRDLVLLVSDDLAASERVARGHALLRETPPDRRDAIAHLLRDDDSAVVALVAHHALASRPEPRAEIIPLAPRRTGLAAVAAATLAAVLPGA
jgi:AAA family ATP:ADP antiporter